jgi:hypothetical protein
MSAAPPLDKTFVKDATRFILSNWLRREEHLERTLKVLPCAVDAAVGRIASSERDFDYAR